MASPTTIVKYFDNFKGLDLRVSDLKREQGAATEIKNTSLRRTGALSKRKGYQVQTRTTGGHGLFNYQNIQTGSSTTKTEELLTIDENLHKLNKEKFNITYTGSASAYYELSVDDDEQVFYFDVYDDNVRVLHKNLGSGLETSFVNIATLIADIDALPNFDCTSSSALTTEPAAFIPIALDQVIPTTPGIDIEFNTWSQVDGPQGASSPFTGHFNTRNDDGFMNISSASLDGISYFTGNGIGLTKYDGNRVYKAGIEGPSNAPVLINTVAGSLTGIYKYKYTYELFDSKGNIIESVASPVFTSANLSSNDIEIQLDYVQNTSGFNTDQGTIDSGSSGTTISLVDPHNIKQYDNIAILNDVTGEVERRKVLSTTSTSATLDGSVDTLASDIVASSISIKLWRTVSGGSLFFFHSEYVNDGTSATFNITDSLDDSSLGFEFVEPIKKPQVAPENCKYISVWRSQLILSGQETNPNTVYYSDIESGEYFPQPDNQFDIETNSGKEVTGIRALDNSLYIFTDDAIAVVNGDLGTDSFVVDVVSDEGVGCKAHNTIQEIEGDIWFLSESGVYSISSKGLVEQSAKIGPTFKRGNNFDYSQASSFHWIDERKYILLLPVELDDGVGNKYTSSSQTKILVYDRFWDSWAEWDNYDFTGGIENLGDELYIIDRAFDVSTATVKRLTKKIHSTGLTIDYADHDQPISFSYKSHWETLGEPSMFKKYRRIKVHSLDSSLDDFESQSFVVNVALENDYVTFPSSEIPFDFGGGALGWGSSPWGSFPWGEVRLYSLKHKLNQKRAKSTRVTFSNDAINQNVLISGYELDIATPYAPEIKE